MDFFIIGVVSLEYINEDKNGVGDDTQKAESLAALSPNSGSNSEPLAGPQRASDEESLGLLASYITK